MARREDLGALLQQGWEATWITHLGNCRIGGINVEKDEKKKKIYIYIYIYILKNCLTYMGSIFFIKN